MKHEIVTRHYIDWWFGPSDLPMGAKVFKVSGYYENDQFIVTDGNIIPTVIRDTTNLIECDDRAKFEITKRIGHYYSKSDRLSGFVMKIIPWTQVVANL